MEFQLEHRYERDADTVLRMVTDRQYFERKYQSMEVEDFTIVSCTKSADAFSIHYRYRAAASTRVPDFARKLFGESVGVEQTDNWDLRERQGRIDIVIQGVPAINMHARTQLLPAGDGALIRLHWEVRCTVPLIGGRLERAIADDLRGRADADLAVSRRLLEAY